MTRARNDKPVFPPSELPQPSCNTAGRLLSPLHFFFTTVYRQVYPEHRPSSCEPHSRPSSMQAGMPFPMLLLLLLTLLVLFVMLVLLVVLLLLEVRDVRPPGSRNVSRRNATKLSTSCTVLMAPRLARTTLCGKVLVSMVARHTAKQDRISPREKTYPVGNSLIKPIPSGPTSRSQLSRVNSVTSR